MNKFVTFVLAATGGFVAGVLLAPKSGKETREELKRKATDYKGKAHEGFDEAKKGARLVKTEVAEGAEVVKEIALDVGDSVGTGVDRFKEEVGRRAGVIKKDVSETSRGVKRAVRSREEKV